MSFLVSSNPAKVYWHRIRGKYMDGEQGPERREKKVRSGGRGEGNTGREGDRARCPGHSPISRETNDCLSLPVLPPLPSPREKLRP